MSDEPSSDERPSSSCQLVAHDIRVQQIPLSDGGRDVEATVECELKSCRKTVEECAVCLRFARIEVHEAGYVLLCRSRSANEASDSSPDEPAPHE